MTMFRDIAKHSIKLHFLCFLSLLFLVVDQSRGADFLKAKYPNLVYQGNQYTLEIELYDTNTPDGNKDGYIDSVPLLSDIAQKGWKCWAYRQPEQIEVADEKLKSALLFSVYTWSILEDDLKPLNLFTVPGYTDQLSMFPTFHEYMAQSRTYLLEASQDPFGGIIYQLETFLSSFESVVTSTIVSVSGIPSYEVGTHEVAGTLAKILSHLITFGSLGNKITENLEAYRPILEKYGLLDPGENANSVFLSERLDEQTVSNKLFWKEMVDTYAAIYPEECDPTFVKEYFDVAFDAVKIDLKVVSTQAVGLSAQAYFTHGLSFKWAAGAGAGHLTSLGLVT